MFLHVTARIEGRKHDGLLNEVGGRGFPSFFIMEGDGSVVGQVKGQRSVDTFEKAVNDGKAFVALRAKAQSGDKAAQVDFLLARARIGQVDVDKLQEEAKSLKMTPAQEKEYKGLIANKMMNLERTRAVGKAFVAMEKKGFVPGEEFPRASFYYSIFQYADLEKDLKLMEHSYAEVEKVWSKSKRYEAYLKQMRDKIAKAKKD
ncbi:MAG: hypothetical protein ACYTGN_08465 [Planctomycetota bacterium]|jgi:hypothetical protein